MACDTPHKGRFCPNCGEPSDFAERPPDSLLDFPREWADRIFRLDNIVWSTLGLLLFNPGRLSVDWWEGRRARRMSPVRVLFTVLLSGTLLAFVQREFLPQAQVDTGRLVQVFTYQSALVIALVSLVVLPRLLPKALQRTPYQHATVALYESAFLSLLAWVFYGAIVIWEWALLPIPAALGLALVHALAHLKYAYGMSWPGAVVRTGVLALCAFFAMAFTSAILAITGLQNAWI